jgi:hypothetical protein
MSDKIDDAAHAKRTQEHMAFAVLHASDLTLEEKILMAVRSDIPPEHYDYHYAAYDSLILWCGEHVPRALCNAINTMLKNSYNECDNPDCKNNIKMQVQNFIVNLAQDQGLDAVAIATTLGWDETSIARLKSNA